MALRKYRVTRVGPDGKEKTFTQRGAENDAEAMKHAIEVLVNVPTRRAVRSGAPAPDLKISKVEYVGDSDEPFGFGAPAGAKSVDLEEFSLKHPDGTPKNSAAEILAKSGQ